MDKLINSNTVNNNISQNHQIITEYVETGEGDGISVFPLKEKEMNIDEKNVLLLNNNTNII